MFVNINATMEKMNLLRNCFLNAIESVKPQTLIAKWMSREEDYVKIGEKLYPLKNTYVVGFGKAVAGMVPHIEKTFQTADGGSYIKEGILSIPHGYLAAAQSRNEIISTHPNIKLYEGAKFNLPDLDALNTAHKIKQLVDELDEDSLLLILISGGGSALLPLPIYPLSLEEKNNIIKTLSLAGAPITVINTFRKAVSATKGGNLVANVKAKVVTFILSDVINSPLGVIASGPTVPNDDNPDLPFKICEQYDIPMSNSLRSSMCNRFVQFELNKVNENVENILIGDNITALDFLFEHIKGISEFNIIPIKLSTELAGDATSTGKEMTRLAFAILEIISTKNINISLQPMLEELEISEENSLKLKALLQSTFDDLSNPMFCLLFGGETTVQVRGPGRGGRNQHMVLSASLEMEQIVEQYNRDGEIIFLSGGTDGIDGPTDAAGAITWFNRTNGGVRLQATEARKQGLPPNWYLKHCRSFDYYTKLAGSKYLIKTGLTGTNVMDLQLLLIKQRDPVLVSDL